MHSPTASSSGARLAVVRAAIANATLLAGCTRIYLDLGSNTGNVLRSLFEPEAFPRATLQPIFRQYFGQRGAERRASVCAVAFEPNPLHVSRLESIEERFRTQGARLTVLTTTAASTADTHNVSFYPYPDGPKEAPAWGATLFKRPDGALNSRTSAVPVDTVDLTRWMSTVLDRAGTDSPTVIMKMDIEGAEFDVATRLLALGVLCRLRVLLVEFHAQPKKLSARGVRGGTNVMRGGAFAEVYNWMVKRANSLGGCNVTLLPLEDALTSDAPLSSSRCSNIPRPLSCW